MSEPSNIPYNPPAVIERTSRGDVTLDVYTRLLKDRIIWLGTEINGSVSNGIMAQLLYLEHSDPDEDIYMYINSPGGAISDGLAIYDTMQFIKPDVVTICAGGSGGISTLLLCAGATGKRYALPNAMIHLNPAASDEAEADEAAKVKSKARLLKSQQQRVRETLTRHTNQSIERISEDFNRDEYITPEEAIEYGLIDEIITKSPNL